MLLIHLLFALVLAVVLAAIFGAAFRRNRTAAEFWFFFILLFLLIWAGGMWVIPFGPYLWGAPFLSFLLVGLLFAFLLSAIVPSPNASRRLQDPEVKATKEEREAAITLNIFFYILIIALIVFIIMAYL